MPSFHSFSTLLQLTLTLPHVLALPYLQRRANSGDVSIQLFDWNWDSVANECAWIGNAGYRYVQVSPAQEHIEGPQWWTAYQAVSYNIQSRRGSRDQFKNMVDTCKQAGVGVISDVIVNHMAGIDSGVGVAGTSFSHYNYPVTPYTADDFHYCETQGHAIADWTSASQIQNCQLSNLADLKTENESVRQKIAAHLKDLLSLGVAGFRIDAAKHIPVGDLQQIISAAGTPEYITQEVVWQSGTILPSQYQTSGDVTEFLFQKTVRDAFLGHSGSISELRTVGSSEYLESSKANVFLSNHDSERNGDDISPDSPSNTLANANAFMLAFPYGHPTILSSFKFSNRDDGAPNGGQASCNDGSYLCQHRALEGLVKFRNNAIGQSVSNWVSPQTDRIAFGRGASGFVVINNSDEAWSDSFKTSLADGQYCQVAGTNDCSTTISVSGGSFQASVPARQSIAIHTGSTA